MINNPILMIIIRILLILLREAAKEIQSKYCIKNKITVALQYKTVMCINTTSTFICTNTMEVLLSIAFQLNTEKIFFKPKIKMLQPI